MLKVVHCVDTEGPLYESLEATFDRVRSIYGIDLPPTRDNLKRIQTGEIDFGAAALSRAAAVTFSPTQISLLSDWDELEQMLDRVDSKDLRNAVVDSAGCGWFINWHCLAHYGFDPEKNPRRRDLGPHAIFDRYSARYANSRADSIHWHFHPVPLGRQANHCATSYVANPAIFELISKRILDRMWFPCVNRPGFHAERPDSHWFLEQWLPFDIANMRSDTDTGQPDLGDGRWGDWRRAPSEWVIYHPDHDDYQQPGNCRRAIARCLMLEGRWAPLTAQEIENAFVRAEHEPTVLAFVSHDFRDLTPGITFVRNGLAEAARRHPRVEWLYSDAAAAMRECLGLGDSPHARFTLRLEPHGAVAHRLTIELDRDPFGPQPWFCMKLDDGTAAYDNLDQGAHPRMWHYTFDAQTTPLASVRVIGLAANTANGRTSVITLDPATGDTREAFHN